jgi:hypothetical protein
MDPTSTRQKILVTTEGGDVNNKNEDLRKYSHEFLFIILTYLQLLINLYSFIFFYSYYFSVNKGLLLRITIMNRMTKWLVFLFLVIFIPLILGSPAIALEDEVPGRSDFAFRSDDSGFNPGLWFVSVFRDHISAVDGDRCPSFPTCSAYSVQSFKKHSFFMGWMMTVDRLIHEGKDETSVSPLVYSGGKLRIFDPIENNDFWWFPRDRKHSE